MTEVQFRLVDQYGGFVECLERVAMHHVPEVGEYVDLDCTEYEVVGREWDIRTGPRGTNTIYINLRPR